MKGTIIYLIRHSLSRGNLNNIFGGDSELAEEGKAQTLQLIKKLGEVKPSAIYTSDTIRTRQTAEILASRWKVPVIINTEIRERHYGNLEGKKVLDEHKQIHNALIIKDPKLLWDCHLTQDDETNRQAFDRFFSGLNSITKDSFGKTSLVVSHGNVIRCLLVHLGVGTFAELRSNSFENTGYVKLGYNNQEFKIIEISGLKLGK